MIEPPETTWPPKAFTPSRCEFESRPFLELPNPFLCAIPDELLSYFFFLAEVLFFALVFAFFLGAAAALARGGSPPSSAAASFLGLGARAGRSGAVNFCPSKAISVMRTAVNGWRCPRSFLYCFLRL